MAKKIDTRHIVSGYTDWGVRRTIKEAENIARWNPWLAHAWMQEARDHLSIDIPELFQEFENAVYRINTYWIRLSRFHWFNEQTFWVFNKESTGLTLLKNLNETETPFDSSPFR